MTGMKEGAGEDPFAEDTASTGTTDRPDNIETASSTDSHAETAETVDSQRTARQQSIQIPYKFRRGGVQDGRDRVPLFLQKDTKSAERDALRELEERFDDDVSLTDLREALMKVGLQHLDEAEIHLEEWGYGMTFE
ncbi:hypothetical protein ACFFQF_28065 [Haladaptatus pallidirubidus]|uniref:Uncharacterized protein n=1 Tax=Haladaptatus pallidirubidus TaxID=1008152 RepID=A0AAV3UJA8_9EURY|nr:hypothetical protein [Haladaptatus pallidirubidus]